MSTATESKHTPGPLYVRSRKGMVHAVATKDHAIIQRTTDDDIAWFNRLEDAVLFKAAPAMLEALEQINHLATVELNGTGRDYFATTRGDIAAVSSKAIKLAKGESQ